MKRLPLIALIVACHATSKVTAAQAEPGQTRDSEQAAPIQGFAVMLGFNIKHWLRTYVGYSMFEKTKINAIQTDL